MSEIHDMSGVFKKYVPGKVFIETGTCYGRTVKFVLACGAIEVRSVEAGEVWYTACKDMFTNDRRVKLWHGLSDIMLPEMMKDITEPAIIFLDAHPAGIAHLGPTFGHDKIGKQGGESFTQQQILQRELLAIATHPIKSHTIILDDQQLQGEEDIQEKYKEILLQINPKYRISLTQKEGLTPPVGCLIAELI